MPKKQLIILVLILFGALMLGGFLKSKSGPEQNQQSHEINNQLLTANELAYDFGNVPINGGKVEHKYTVKNNNTEKVTLNKLYTSCMCTEAVVTHAEHVFGPFGMQGHGYVPKFAMNLDPGQEAVVTAVFDPAAHGPAGVGVIERVVTLETDKGMMDFQFKANVTP